MILHTGLVIVFLFTLFLKPLTLTIKTKKRISIAHHLHGSTTTMTPNFDLTFLYDQSEINSPDPDYIFYRPPFTKTRGKRAGKKKHGPRPISIIKHRPPRPVHYEPRPPTTLVTVNTTLDDNSNTTPTSTDSTGQTMTFLSFNAQSCKNKTNEIHEILSDSSPDVVFITETFLSKPADDHILNELLPTGFSILSVPRPNRRGGGVAIIYKSLFRIKSSSTSVKVTSFEFCLLTIATPSSDLLCLCIYRPPPSNKNNSSIDLFLTEFSLLLDSLNSHRSLIIAGDFNFHIDNPNLPATKKFNTLLSEHSLHQHIHAPTHRQQHTLDLVLTRNETSHLLSDPLVEDICLSDHFVISFNYTFAKPTRPRKSITSRSTKNIDIDVFKTELSSSLSQLSSESPVNIDNFNTAVIGVLDKFAPEKSRNVPIRPDSPWINDVVLESKRSKRQAERRWKKTGLVVHREIFINKKREHNNTVNEEKSKYLNEKLSSSTSSKELFRLCDRFLGDPVKSNLPTNFELDLLPNLFNNYFIEKVDKIRNDLDTSNTKPVFEPFHGKSLSSFEPVTPEIVKNTIVHSPKNFCKLDPLPPHLFFASLDVLLPYITSIFNDSLSNGSFPSSFKTALVSPLLKKPSLDPDTLKNFRPVSNLPFLSKVLERIVLKQLLHHFSLNHLEGKFQSAYKSNHSTETALLRVTSDILNGADNGDVSLLALLDLSAAFDTIDHSILLERLETSFGIQSTPLLWLNSYLSERAHQVKIGDLISSPLPIKYGVPQGSVLGPVLFSLYVQPLSLLIHEHDFPFHFYADDTQIYKSVPLPLFDKASSDLFKCISSVNDWMHTNKLKLNQDKTELIVFGSRKAINNLPSHSITIGNNEIPFSSKARNLGVILDETLSMDQAVSSIRQSCYLHLRKISRIRPFIPEEAAKQLVISFVLSKIDYCNSLFHSTSCSNINKLQTIQNHAARLVKQVPKSTNPMPLLYQLHWLPVKARITYKIAVIVYNTLSSEFSPSYLKDLLSTYNPTRTLRSQSKHLLHKPIPRLSFGQKAFSYSAPFVWNSLPDQVKSATSIQIFKKRLKTYLFTESFD